MTEKRKFQIGDDGEIKEGDPILYLWEEEKAKRSVPLWRKATRNIIPAFVIFQMIAFTLLCGCVGLVVIGGVDLDPIRCKITNTCRTTTAIPPTLTSIPQAAAASADDAEQPCDQAALANRSNKIAYISTKPTDFGVVYLTDYNTTRVACKLFSSGDGIYALAWSPDGRQIAFLGSRGIWLADRDGAHQKLLYSVVGEAYNDDSLDWSPDGKQIVYSLTVQSQGITSQNIFTLDIAGLSSHPVTGGNSRDQSPRFSPDGKYIVFVSDRDGNEEIYTVDIDGKNLLRLTTNDVPDIAPSWSPDGNQIVFVSDWRGYPNIFVMDADGSGRRNITSDKVRAVQPVWSPDGKSIAFVSYRDGNDEIYAMESGGGSLHRLTFDNRADDHSPVWVR